MTIYRVIDARPGTSGRAESTVEASTPEAAGKLTLGLDMVRGGRNSDLVARVYWTDPGQPMSMVRLYLRAEDRSLIAD
jgi:hypothetical protein